MADQPKRPPESSRDFLSWGKEFLKDALSKTPPAEQRRTRPLGADSLGRRQTTFLNEDAVAMAAMPRASVSDLARLNIIFTDNAHRPLFESLGRTDAPFSAETERMVMDRCLLAVREVKDRVAAVEDLVPRGRYAGLPLAQVIETLSTRDLRLFFYFVRENPRAFIGKPLRLAEAFVAWLVDHGDAEARPDPLPPA